MAHNEQIFTPIDVVKGILDHIGYKSDNDIRKKHIVDPSCGDGHFIGEIVLRYINACIKDRLLFEEIIPELQTYIHGLEIDEKLCQKAQQYIVSYLYSNGVNCDPIIFDIRNVDTLDFKEFNGKMDYVVGNPPYCKVHDLKEKYDKVKEYSFAENGMTDLYLVFFEIGINMLNENGKLGYITPNSWLTSVAGNNFRKYLQNNKNILKGIIQLGHKQIFPEATTFTCITLLDKTKDNNLLFYKNDFEEVWKSVSLFKAFIKNKLYLASDNELKLLNNIMDNNVTTNYKIKVKNGFATLNDKLFILSEKLDDEDNIFEKNNILIWKASKDKITTAIYPYDKEGKALKYENICFETRLMLQILKKAFEIETTKDDWYLYGRYQGIKDMSKYRIGINTLINDSLQSINMRLLEPYVGIYSGLYIVCEDNDNFIKENYEKIHDLIISSEFIKYIQNIGKYKNGGYYTFSSKDVENYLNYILFK